MKNYIINILIVIGIGLFIWFYTINANFTPQNQVFLERINKLDSKIDSINNQKDSIRIIVDSTHIKIITNEKHYQEVVNTIISQPASSDYEFVTNYILFRQSTN